MKRVINDLFDYNDLKIYQDEEKFKFSLDSILLAEFVNLKKNPQLIVDFCTGNAPIPLILSTKTKANIYGFELQKSIYELGYLSVLENKLENQIKIVNANIKEAFEYILPESVDIVTCNPPYFKYDKESIINDDREKAIARHEIEMTFEDIVVSAKYILKNKGCLYIVHRVDRLEELISHLSKYSFAVKRLQFVYSNFQKNAIMVLIKAVKNGQIGMKVNPPLNVLDYKSYQGIFEGR